jgi:predicted amidohydrolase
MAFLPEMSLLLDRDRARSAPHIAREVDSPWPAALQALAQKHALWLHSGSIPLLSDNGARRVNRSHVIAADGSIRARYDKIHMFDVTLPTGENWTESAAYAGGDALVVINTPIGRLGLSICYDLRFPELYRALVDQGAALIAVPAAFTVPTGEAHWHVLMRARAIETGCHVLAAAQCGNHEDGRATYGHSLIVDPWGAVQGDAGAECDGSGYQLIFAPIDAAAVDRARDAIPLARSRKQRMIAI